MLNTDNFLSIKNEEIDNLQLYLKLDILTHEELSKWPKRLDEVKGDDESLDEVDNDNDDNRDEKDDDYNKDGDEDDINANNNKVGNPREIRPTYCSNTDRYPINNNYFV